MNRKTFIHHLAVLTSSATFLSNRALAHVEIEDFYAEILKANENETRNLLLVFAKPIKLLRRGLGFDLANLAAAYVEPRSAFFHGNEVREAMNSILTFLFSQQKPDGTLDFGNLSSPPDTAFIIDPLCAAARIAKSDAKLEDIYQKLQKFITKACDQLAVGGVHTPNHRWVVSAALAKANSLFPNPKYTKRIEEWLSEVVFQDKDGVYLERSITYSEVVDRSLISMAKYANKPALLKMVEKNLDWLCYQTELNGEMVTVQSRRQDSFLGRKITEFYVHYRYMAIKQSNAVFGAMAKFIETQPNFDAEVKKDLLYYVLEDSTLKQPMPISTMPTEYEKLFDGISLLRKRKQDQTMYFYAGADWPIIVASGRATNPNFFGFRKGTAILRHIRLSTSFFSTGYFRGKGIQKLKNSYKISQKFQAPYYQPLPEAYKKKNGDYALSQSTDGRFWNKMDFSHRPVSNLQTLETAIIYEEKAQKQLLHFDIKGPEGVRVVIELCFDENGKLSNCQPADGGEPNDHFLTEGYGTFSNGGDHINFGPGIKQHESIKGLEGELYSTHFGTLRTKGQYVFLTAICPFKYTLEIG